MHSLYTHRYHSFGTLLFCDQKSSRKVPLKRRGGLWPTPAVRSRFATTGVVTRSLMGIQLRCQWPPLPGPLFRGNRMSQAIASDSCIDPHWDEFQPNIHSVEQTPFIVRLAFRRYFYVHSVPSCGGNQSSEVRGQEKLISNIALSPRYVRWPGSILHSAFHVPSPVRITPQIPAASGLP